MNRFRKKPVIIEAIQWTGDHYCFDKICLWSKENVHAHENNKLLVETLEGIMTVSLGDWIIRGVKGEYYPCKPDIFYETYEPVE